MAKITPSFIGSHLILIRPLGILVEGFVLLHLIKDPDKWVYCDCPHHFLAHALLMWWTTSSTQPPLYKHKSCFCPSVRTQRCTAASEGAKHKRLIVLLLFIYWCRLRSSLLWMFFLVSGREHSREVFHLCMHPPWDISWSDSDTWTCADNYHQLAFIYCCGGRNIYPLSSIIMGDGSALGFPETNVGHQREFSH